MTRNISCEDPLAPFQGAEILPTMSGGLRYASTSGYCLAPFGLPNTGLNKIRLGRRVEIDGRAAQLISLQNSQRRRVDVNCDEVATRYVWIAELMNVGNF